ncbi:hypothetical protein CA603_45170 [Paraburkholderia hospita]|nr:hypothetical protein CA603_45170 [Paraburkholderia hospita]
MKLAGSRSLREQVQKWLAPDVTTPIRIAQYGRLHLDGTWFVLVEAAATSGPCSMYFFRHSDGSWNVYPPAFGSGTIYLSNALFVNTFP